jgi:hypothetical protein
MIVRSTGQSMKGSKALCNASIVHSKHRGKILWRVVSLPLFNELLAELDFSWSQYLLGLRASVQKAIILYKRDVAAI